MPPPRDRALPDDLLTPLRAQSVVIVLELLVGRLDLHFDPFELGFRRRHGRFRAGHTGGDGRGIDRGHGASSDGFDIDGLEPVLCPDTGTPVPGGLSFNEMLELLRALGRTRGSAV